MIAIFSPRSLATEDYRTIGVVVGGSAEAEFADPGDHTFFMAQAPRLAAFVDDDRAVDTFVANIETAIAVGDLGVLARGEAAVNAQISVPTTLANASSQTIA